MAIDPNTIQMLGMILDRQTRKHEGEAARGHDMNMFGLQAKQRSLESDIDWRRSEKARLDNETEEWSRQFAEFGASPKLFGIDDQSGQIINDIGESLIDRVQSLSEIISSKENYLGEIKHAHGQMVRGAEMASTLDINYEFVGGELMESGSDGFFKARELSKNPDDLVKFLTDEGFIDSSMSKTDINAFTKGFTSALANEERVIREKDQKMKEEAFKNENVLNELAIESQRFALQEARSDSEFQDFERTMSIRSSIEQLNQINPADYMSSIIAGYASLKAVPEGEKTNAIRSQEKQFDDQFTVVIDTASKNLSNMIVSDFGISDKNAVILRQAIVDSGNNLKESLAYNQSHAIHSIENAGVTLHRSLNGRSLDEAIKAGDVDFNALGTILAYTTPIFSINESNALESLNAIIQRGLLKDSLNRQLGTGSSRNISEAQRIFNQDFGREIASTLMPSIMKLHKDMIKDVDGLKTSADNNEFSEIGSFKSDVRRRRTGSMDKDERVNAGRYSRAMAEIIKITSPDFERNLTEEELKSRDAHLENLRKIIEETRSDFTKLRHIHPSLRPSPLIRFPR